jgi:hypothetical protein
MDSWNGQKPDVIFRAKEERYAYPSFFAPERQPLPRDNSWQGQWPDYLFKPKEERYAYPSYFGIENQSFPRGQEWYGQYPDAISRVRDLRYTYESFFSPFVTAAPVVLPDRWLPSLEKQADRLKDQQYISDSEFSPDPIPIVLADRWHPLIEVRANDFKDQTYIVDQNWFWDSSYAADYSGSLYPSLVKQADRLKDQQYITDSEFSPDPIPIVLADKWHPLIEVKANDFKDQTYIVDQSWFWDSTYDADYSGTWQYQDVNPFERPDNRWTAPWEARTDIVIGAVIYADKWIGYQPDILFRAKDLRILYPSLSWPEIQPVPRMDGWSSTTLPSFFKGKEERYLYPSIFWPEILPPIFVDRWIGFQPDIIFRKTDPRFTYPSLAFYPLPLPSPIFLDKWVPDYPDRIDRLQSRTWITYPVLELTQSQRPETIYPDKWLWVYPDYFRAKEERYLYPSLSWPEIQPLVLPDRYYEPIVQPVQRVFRQYDRPGDVFVVAPAFNKLDWIPSVPDFINRLKNQNYITIGDLILTPAQRPEIITLDKWYNQTSLPFHLFNLRRLQYLYPDVSEWFVGVPINAGHNTRLIIVEGRLAYKVGKIEYIWL